MFPNSYHLIKTQPPICGNFVEFVEFSLQFAEIVHAVKILFTHCLTSNWLGIFNLVLTN